METGPSVCITTSLLSQQVRIIYPRRPPGSFIGSVASPPLKDLTLKVFWKSYLYHQVVVNDHGIANALLPFIFINMKVSQYYLSGIKLWHEKWHLDVMFFIIWSCGCTILYLIGTHISLVRFSVSPFNHDVGRPAIPQTCYAVNYSFPMFLTYSEAGSYYCQGVLSPTR